MNNPKPFYQSKTIVINMLLAMMAVVESQLGLLQSVINPTHYIFIMAFMAGLNVFLRAITTAPVVLKNTKKPRPAGYQEYDGEEHY